MDTKRCPKCGEVKPKTKEFFGANKRQHDGFQTHCKLCRKLESASKAAYHAANAEKIRKQKREYSSKNKDRLRRKNADWWERNREAALAKKKLYREVNAESLKEKRRTEARQKPLLGRLRWHRYQARKRGLPDTLTTQQWDTCLDYWGHCCAVCGRPKGLWHTLSPDHWIPLASPDCPGTVVENVLPLCHGVDGCNNSKQHFNADEWLVRKFGAEKAAAILGSINTYFDLVKRGLTPTAK